MKHTTLVLGLLLAGGSTVLAAVPFDRPLSEQTLSVPNRGGGQDRMLKVHCAIYPAFMVRDVHEGGDIGTASVSVTPVSSSAPPQCSATPGHDAKELPGLNGMDVGGVAGRFLLLSWADGQNGATSFSVFDAIKGQKLYTDVVKLDGFRRFAASSDGNMLDLDFVRVLNVPCSLLSGPAACWNRFVREARLPAEIARRAPPVQACASTYAQHNGSIRVSVTDPSVVEYDVSMTVSATGAATVLSRGELTCWPSN